MKNYIKNYESVKNIREAKQLVTFRIRELENIILNGNRREKDNAKRALPSYQLILVMLGKLPNIELEKIKNVNIFNCGDIFELVHSYERTGEIEKSGRGKPDLRVGNIKYEFKALVGRNAITVSPLESGKAEILLEDGRVYRLSKENYNKLIKKYAKQKVDKYNGERMRITPNKEIKEYIKENGKVVKDYYKD